MSRGYCCGGGPWDGRFYAQPDGVTGFKVYQRGVGEFTYRLRGGAWFCQ